MSAVAVIDLSSSSYLGLRHTAHALRPWTALTTGKPALLGSPPLTREIERDLGVLVGREALVYPSSLHAFWDVFAVTREGGGTIAVDSTAYPIARWAAACARSDSRRVVSFAHHDPDDLHRQVVLPAVREPVTVVTDGLCPTCGRIAPLAAYRRVLRHSGGCIVVDDTQAFGVLGRPTPGEPYGAGGGGVATHLDLSGPDLIIVASMAKAYGVPAAFVAGNGRLIARLSRSGPTRMHCSPASNAHVSATAHALAVNETNGELIRRRLHALVRRLRIGLRKLGLSLVPGRFPVQVVRSQVVPAPVLHERLIRLGVNGVLHSICTPPSPALSFVLTAAHTERDIDAAIAAISIALSGTTATADRGRRVS